MVVVVTVDIVVVSFVGVNKLLEVDAVDKWVVDGVVTNVGIGDAGIVVDNARVEVEKALDELGDAEVIVDMVDDDVEVVLDILGFVVDGIKVLFEVDFVLGVVV